jgi:hypothetical protein
LSASSRFGLALHQKGARHLLNTLEIKSPYKVHLDDKETGISGARRHRL